MKKKLVTAMLMGAISLSIVGCGNKEATSEPVAEVNEIIEELPTDVVEDTAETVEATTEPEVDTSTTEQIAEKLDEIAEDASSQNTICNVSVTDFDILSTFMNDEAFDHFILGGKDYEADALYFESEDAACQQIFDFMHDPNALGANINGIPMGSHIFDAKDLKVVIKELAEGNGIDEKKRSDVNIDFGTYILSFGCQFDSKVKTFEGIYSNIEIKDDAVSEDCFIVTDSNKWPIEDRFSITSSFVSFVSNPGDHKVDESKLKNLYDDKKTAADSNDSSTTVDSDHKKSEDKTGGKVAGKADSVVGSWEGVAEDPSGNKLDVTMVFYNDGTGLYTLSQGSEGMEFETTYEIKDSTHMIVSYYEGVPGTEIKYSLNDDGTLTICMDGTTSMTLHKTK